MRFARAVLTRPAPFTIVLLVANIFLFLLTALSSGGENSPSFNSVLVAYGAKTNSLINAGEWWRFVTPVFLHGGIIHLLMNMYGLWVLGPFVERLYGSAKFVFFWVITGVAGVLGSYLTVRPGMQLNMVSRFLFKNGDPVSVGASGALFGLIGVLFVFGIKFRHELPDGFKRAFGTGMLPTILLNVFIGFTIPVIDNAAHMGGLVAGAALALVVGYKRPGESASVAVFWHILHKTSEADATAFLTALNNGQQALGTAIEGKLQQNDFESAIKALDAAPRLDEQAGVLLDELKSLLVRAQEMSKSRAAGKVSARAVEQQRKVIKDLESWIEKRDQWVEAEGEKHGIKLVKPPAPPEQQPQTEEQPRTQQQRPDQKQRNQK